MRRIALFGGVVILVCGATALAAVVWVDGALAAVKESPGTLCLTTKDHEKIVAGDFPSDRRDSFVVKAIDFHQGVPRMLWWHLRGAAIQLTYVTFWSPSRRADEFNRLVSRMKDCSPQPGRG